MTDLSQSQIDSMAKIMQAMEGGSDALKSNSVKEDASLGAILEGFRAATDDLLETAKVNPDFADAIETVRTPTGVRIGSWSINVRGEKGLDKYYDIMHHDEVVAADIRLYEAAQALIKCLKSGDTFTSGRVKAIMELEREYARSLNDVVTFSHKMRISEGAAYDIAEARHGEARRQALVAKRTIEKLI